MTTVSVVLTVAVAVAVCCVSVAAVSLRAGQQSLATAQTENKYMFEGPAGYGLPIHEAITIRAAEQAGFKNSAKTAPSSGAGSSTDWTSGKYDLFLSPQYVDIMRGAQWPDDPSCILFDDDTATDAANFCPTCAGKFASYLKTDSWGTGACHAEPNAMTCRSHFGSLSFIHGQVEGDGVEPAVVREKMLQWAKLLYMCATGDKIVDPSKPLQSLFTTNQFDKVLRALPVKARTSTMDQLFCNPSKFWSTPHRCAGALGHLVEDTFSASHVRRLCKNDAKTQFGDVVSFTAYGSQSAGVHELADIWTASSWHDYHNLAGKIATAGGATDALAHMTKIFKFLKAKKKWATVETYLKTKVWNFATHTLLSSSGGFHAGSMADQRPPCLTECQALSLANRASGTAPDFETTVTKLKCEDQQEVGSDHIRLIASCDDNNAIVKEWTAAKTHASTTWGQKFEQCKKLALAMWEIDTFSNDHLASSVLDIACPGTHTVTFEGGAAGRAWKYVIEYVVKAKATPSSSSSSSTTSPSSSGGGGGGEGGQEIDE